MRTVIKLGTLVFCITALTLVGWAFAEEKKEEPPKKVTVDFLLESGEQSQLKNVRGDYPLTFFWESFQLGVEYYDIQKCDFLGEPEVVGNNFYINAKVLLSDGTELAGRIRFHESKSIEGDWEFGTRKILWKNISFVSFQRSSGPPEPDVKPIGTITDQKGNAIQMLSFPKMFDTYEIHNLQDAIFGTWDRTEYFALPFGGGCVFLPRSDIMQILGKESEWEVQTKDGDKLSFVITEDSSIHTVEGTSNVGKFELKITQLGSLKFERPAPPVEKPESGLASQSLSQICGILTDRSGLTHKLEGIQFYHLKNVVGIWLGRTPEDEPLVSGGILAQLPDESEVTILLHRLSSISFKDGKLLSVTSKETGRTIEIRLHDPDWYGRTREDEGFVGLVTIGPGKYWAYFPTDFIKDIRFE